MDFDLEDLLEDVLAPTSKQPATKATTAQRHTSSAVGRFGGGAGQKAGADLDDLGDSFNFDDDLGGGGQKAAPPQKQTTFGISGANYSGAGSTKAQPRNRNDDTDDSFFGVGNGGSRGQLQTLGGGLGGNASRGPGSFGGGSRQGSYKGSRQSAAEQEADDFDALLDGMVGTEKEEKAQAPPAKAAREHIPTGTFRKNSDDGWDDLNFGENTGGSMNRGGGGYQRGNAIGGGSRFAAKPKDDDDFDLVDDILDNLTADKEEEKRPKTAGVANHGVDARKESLWSAGGPNNQRPASGSHFKHEDDLDALDEDDDVMGSALNQQFSGNKSHQKSSDQLQDRRSKLFGAGGRANSASGLQTFGGAQNQTSAGQINSQMNFAQDNDPEEMSPGLGGGKQSIGTHQNSGSNLNPNFPGFHGTTASAASQDSGVETIENPYSRANKRRMMPRPPTQSGQPQNESHMQSVGSAGLQQQQQQQRPMTGPASRPPLKNASSPIINQDLNSDYMNPLYAGSQGSAFGDAVQPGNFNFAPPPRTAGIPPGGVHLGASNLMSEADFERAHSDPDDDDDASYYVEEEVTDDEAMERQRQEQRKSQAVEDGDGETDDSDMGFYMPSIMRTGKDQGETPPREKPKKITRKIRTKKKKTLSNKKKPPRGISPPIGRQKTAAIGGSTDNIQRKSQTMSEEAKNAMQLSNPTSAPFMLIPQGGIGSTITSGNNAVPFNKALPGAPGGTSQKRMLEMMGPKEILQYEIEQERDKIAAREKRQREAMETQRKMHQKAIEALQGKFEEQRKFIELEKQRLIEDKARTIELEKQKLISLQKIDLDSRDLTHQKSNGAVRELYFDQHDSLRKQLEQKVQMNKLAEEVSKSSGDINSMIQKLSAEQEGQLRSRESVILQKDQNLAERRRIFEEKRVQLQQRRRKIEAEQNELAQRQQETSHEYEQEKKQTYVDIEDKETTAGAGNREIRSRTIDLEVEVKRAYADEERVRTTTHREKQDSIEKMEELQIETKQIDVSRQDFRKEMNVTEIELRKKLEHTENQSKDLAAKERAFKQQQTEFDEEYAQVMHMNNQLQEQIERYSMQRETFDRRAQAVKEQGENDQLDSEKIGFFKANKERIKDEMMRLQGALDEEKQTIGEDRVKLEIFKNELRTKQKAIETMRYEYIKATSKENMMHFADQAKDLALYNLKKDHGGQDATGYGATKDLYPMASNKSPLGGKPAPPVANSALLSMASNQSTFNYNDYMKRLNDKLSIAAPQTKKMVGTGFQEFLLKERQQYLTSVASYENDSGAYGAQQAPRSTPDYQAF